MENYFKKSFKNPGAQLVYILKHYKRIYAVISDKIKIIDLLNVAKYPEYFKQFPDNLLLNLETNNKNLFNIHDFKTELIIVFRDPTFKNIKKVQEINIFLERNDLSTSLPEFSKLYQLVLTTPTVLRDHFRR